MNGGRGRRPRAARNASVSIRWRFYSTDAAEVVKRELSGLPVAGRAAISDAMLRHQKGKLLPRELRNVTADIKEIRVSVGNDPFRLLFAHEGDHDQVLLALTVFYKNSQKLPPADLKRAEKRLADWRTRARQK